MKAPPIVLPKERTRSNDTRTRLWPLLTARVVRSPWRALQTTLKNYSRGRAFPVKHLLKDYSLMWRFLSGGSNKGEHGKDPDPTMDDVEEKDSGFPTPDGCLMIFGGPEAYDSKRRQKVTRREVYMTKPAMPTLLQWLESAITFDRTDHPKNVPQLGRYPLMVDRSSA